MKTYGVTFKEGEKVYYFNFEGEELKLKDKVIVETEQGEQAGNIAKILEEPIYSDEIKSIIRKATSEDIDKIAKNEKDAKKQFSKFFRI